MHHKFTIMAVLIVMGVASITLKLIGGQELAAADKREIDVLTQYLRVTNIKPVTQFNLNREGSFTAHVYRQSKCDGGWIISAMPRNSEAVSLFQRQARYRHYPMGSVTYVLDGASYGHFPETELWMSHKISAIKHMFGISNSQPQPVFAVRGFGNCQKGQST